ncbi:Ribonuclease h [Thalictrum thalictroides]|uniref:Ribonuclease h n=1 Tax=Thalictrum thalictroides TaxID=46969 RepID=A0A7J6VQL6_THATH|nr:Ribonuclease h [Thalictrum thalictroides]
MTTFALPISITDKLTSICRDFWWHGREGSKAIHTIAWEKLEKQKIEGGLGFRNFKDMNLALMTKLSTHLGIPRSRLSTTFKGNVVLFGVPRSRLSTHLGIVYGSLSVLVQNRLFFFWRSLFKAASLFGKGVVVCIGNGRDTSFWEDPWIIWNGQPTCLKDLVDENVCSDVRVANFIEHDARIWDSHKLLEVLPLLVVSTILKVQIRHQSIQDSFKWIAAINSEFSTKSAFSLASSRAESSSNVPEEISFLRKLWKLKIPAHLQLFLWKVFKDCLPTGFILGKHKVQGDLGCVWCNSNVETLDHLMLNCSWSQRLCSIFLLAEIWGMRNKLKFEEVSMRKDRIMKEVIDSARFAWSRWWEDLALSDRHPNSFVEVVDHNFVIHVSVPTSLQRDVVLISSDAAFDRVSGKGAIGVVAIDADGVILATGYRRILAGNAQEAEPLAVEGALILALQKGFMKIKVKGDCQIVMNACRRRHQSPDLSWQCSTIFQNIKLLSLSFELLSFN